MPGLHVNELGRSWNDLVKNIQSRPFDILSAFTTPFAVPAACCVEKRKGAQDWTHKWSFQSFPSESNLGETERPRLAKKSSSWHFSENEMPVYVASAVSSVASASLGSHTISRSHDEVPVYVASAVTSAVAVAPTLSRDNSLECDELPGPMRGVCGECKKVITAKRNVYLAYDVQFCSESCRDRGMDKYASHSSMPLPM